MVKIRYFTAAVIVTTFIRKWRVNSHMVQDFISYSSIGVFREKCIHLFDSPWESYTFPEQEIQELIRWSDGYNKGSSPSDQRMKQWQTYIDLVGKMCIRNRVVDYRALLGLNLLNILAFDWEDDTTGLDTAEAMAEVHKIIVTYFPEKFQAHLLFSWYTYIHNFPIASKYQTKEKIMDAASDLYFPFRNFDAGVHPFTITLAAAYDDLRLLFIISQGYALDLITRGLIYINDVFSFNKERKANESANYLVIKGAITSKPTDLLLEEIIPELSICMSRLKLFFPDYWPVFSFWFRGNLEWSFITHRYHEAG